MLNTYYHHIMYIFYIPQRDKRYIVIQQLTGPSFIKHNKLMQLPKITNVCSNCPKKHNPVYLNGSNYKIILY